MTYQSALQILFKIGNKLHKKTLKTNTNYSHYNNINKAQLLTEKLHQHTNPKAKFVFCLWCRGAILPGLIRSSPGEAIKFFLVKTVFSPNLSRTIMAP